MSIVKRAKASAGAPVRRQAEKVTRGLEDLIHQIKNELVSRFDSLDSGIDEFANASRDQMGLMSSRIATLEAEIKSLRSEVAALRTNP